MKREETDEEAWVNIASHPPLFPIPHVSTSQVSSPDPPAHANRIWCSGQYVCHTLWFQ